jgi:phage N-6-adenine-methyltransferase
MSDEWYSPKSIFDALNVEFDLDVAHPDFKTDVPTKRYYTINDDGLQMDWVGLVWMNPPYSKPTPWIEKWLNHANGLALVPFSKSAWFNKLWASDAYGISLPPNLKFTTPEGKSKQIFMPCGLWAIGDVAKSLLINANLGKIR